MAADWVTLLFHATRKCWCGASVASPAALSEHLSVCPKELQNWLAGQAVDWLKKDAAYWRSIFRAVRREGVFVRTAQHSPSCGHSAVAEAILQERHRRRVEHATAQMPPIESYKDSARWLQGELRRMVAKMGPCVDNVRWARASSRRERKAYRRAKADGCCGSHDAEVVDPLTGARFLIGCNYGH